MIMKKETCPTCGEQHETLSNSVTMCPYCDTEFMVQNDYYMHVMEHEEIYA